MNLSQHTFFILICGACFLLLNGCKEKSKEQELSIIGTNTVSEPITKKLENREQKPAVLDSSNTYRDKNWKPEKGQYYFSEEFTFSYNNAWKDYQGKTSGKFGFYVDPESGTILLEKNTTNFFDEMTQYVIIKTDGDYILGYTNEFGKQKLVKKNVFKEEGVLEDLKNRQKDFKTFFKPKQNSKVFGANEYYPKSLKAKKYERTYLKATDTVEVFIAQTNMPTTALYLVNTVFKELGMPIRWDYGYALPNNHLVVKEAYKTNDGGNLGFELKSIMATEYHIHLPK